MTGTTALDHSFDPNSPAARRDPHPLFHRMREQAPVHRRVGPMSGRAYWYLTSYADVQRALHDPDIGRELDRLPPELAAAHRLWAVDPLAMVRRNVFNLDPPDHSRLRRLLTPAFGPRTVKAVGQRVGEVVDALVAQIADAGGDGRSGPVDVIERLALPIPMVVVAGLVGFPIEDQARLRSWSNRILRSRNPKATRHAGLEFIAYIEAKTEERRDRLAEDLLSRLIRAETADEITHAELVSSVFQLMLAGDETTVNLIGNAILELLRHPDQLARLRAEPGLIGSAVEEVIRFNGPVGHARPSYALADLRIGGTTIPRGDTVIPVLLAANRDPAEFPDPDVFDIGRTPNRHLGFGHGIHFCLGAALARLQARAAIGAFIQRFPGLTLAVEPEELEWTPDLFLHGVNRLPVFLSGA